MSKAKEEKEPEVITEEITVVGIAEAEELQLSGWRLIDVTQIENDETGLTQKKYKFRKE